MVASGDIEWNIYVKILSVSKAQFHCCEQNHDEHWELFHSDIFRDLLLADLTQFVGSALKRFNNKNIIRTILLL